ncbi:hypothetical protein [Arcticibacter sp. MXS-1]|uniref:hypothetical protein n=1 Tax=Arcticibacter sp. MXS-1 TaxID=3341726 RepID=UPI0035A89B12
MNEKTIVLTGRAHTELKNKLEQGLPAEASIGTEDNPKQVQVKEAYLDSDPDFAVDEAKYPGVGEDTEVQVRIKYE